MAHNMEKPALRMLVDGVGPFAELAPPQAAQLLLRAAPLVPEKPFQWTYIDRPADGAVYIVSVQPDAGSPTDGLIWLSKAQRSTIQLGPQVEIEMTVDTCGFAPGTGETLASRVRRRYRLTRAPYNLMAIHYSRGPAAQVPQHFFNLPARGALPPIDTRPFFIAGPRAQAPQAPPQADALARARGAHDAARGGGDAGAAVPADEEGAEDEEVSARALAGARYRRNHEWMNEVFMYAAFGEKTRPPAPPALAQIFDRDTLDAKVAALQAELVVLRARSIRRTDGEEEDGDGDMSMQSAGPFEVAA